MKLKWISVIVIGIMLIGGQAFVANQVKAAESQADVLINTFGDANVSAEEFASSLGDEILPAPAFTDLSYSPVTPCRVVDSRIGGGGMFTPGERQEYYVYGTSDIIPQGGNPAGCASPRGEPSAVHINLTAVPYSGTGNFVAFPANYNPPTASLTNYRAGVQNIANAATIRTYNVFGPKELEVMNNYGYAYLVIDVMGYYFPNPWH